MCHKYRIKPLSENAVVKPIGMKTEKKPLRLAAQLGVSNPAKSNFSGWRERFDLNNVDTLDVRAHKPAGDI